MALKRESKAVWSGSPAEGSGEISLGSGTFSAPYSAAARTAEEGEAEHTNPEELIGAAHAGCFTMSVATQLAKAGHRAERLATTATVHLERGEDGYRITTIELRIEARVDDLELDAFRRLAEVAKETCPVSRALADPEIILQADLVAAA